jgi:formate/nitrite transporter FocA (FNT family)
MHSHAVGEVEMTTSEQKVPWRAVAAGVIMGLALGLIIALIIAIRPELFGALTL